MSSPPPASETANETPYSTASMEQKLQAELSSYDHYFDSEDGTNQDGHNEADDDDDEDDDDAHLSDVSESSGDEEEEDEDENSSDDDDDDDEEEEEEEDESDNSTQGSLALSLQGLLDRAKDRHQKRRTKKAPSSKSNGDANQAAPAVPAVAVVADNNHTKRQEAPAENPVRRIRSMPDMLGELDLGTTLNNNTIEMSDDQTKSLRKFMMRMQSNANPSYMQTPKAAALSKNNEEGGGDTQTHNKSHRGGASAAISWQESQDDTAILTNVQVHKLSPATHFETLILQSIGLSTDKEEDEAYWNSYFVSITEDRTSAYNPPVVAAMRAQNLDMLRRILEQEGPWSMDACNAQGESLLHLAARRRNPALVTFLIQDAGVPVQVRDDWHKTPLHELCWNSTAATSEGTFRSVRLLTGTAPELWLAKDKRGYTALEYVPKEAWKDWCGFLDQHQKTLRAKCQLMSFQRSRDKLQATLQKAESALSLMSNSNRSLQERLGKDE